MADSVGSSPRQQILPQLTTSQHTAVLAAMSNPTNTKRRSRSVAWAMAVSAAVLLAAGTGWVLCYLNSERANQTVSMNSLKQVGDPAESHDVKLAAKAPPAFGGVTPNAVTGLDGTGNPTSLHDIQFRQGGISGPTPPFGGFAGDKADGSSQSGTAATIEGTMGGHVVTNFALGCHPSHTCRDWEPPASEHPSRIIAP